DRPIPEGQRKKLAQFCNVRESSVIPALDAASIYDVPLTYHDVGLDQEVLNAFGMDVGPEPNLDHWREISSSIASPEGEVTIAIVGKYVDLHDAYKSLIEALTHGGIANRTRVNLEWIASEIFEEEDPTPHLDDVNGILVPGGFGERGAEGKIEAVRYAREHNVPYFGICFGMQMAVLEAARNLAGIENATSSEFGPGGEPLVGLMTEWVRGNEVEKRIANGNLGGTLRLGAYPAHLRRESRIAEIYGQSAISERHRHRYEVNVAYRDQLEATGLHFAGMSPDGILPETVERHDHPWFVGVQFHPELKSRPFQPHPLFSSFVAAALEQSRLV
ncbi:MAG: CTP synthase, partial [Pseudomonadota bacterium]